ncbi:MAG: Hpt domain-containing protein [Candidatus Omnitrophica bacterium]|nr:Hpt domain-containing protein [Candidatus Omnitrophota bacterium]
MKVTKEKALRSLGITEQMYNELIDDFIGQFVLDLNDLDVAIEKEDFEHIRQIGHSIKGSAGNLRLEEIAKAAKEIECSEKNEVLIKEKIIVLKKYFEELKELFKKE